MQSLELSACKKRCKPVSMNAMDMPNFHAGKEPEPT